ncbi:MAG: efflux RND transporter periplasmic adaptor subunit [Qingshengfaniella sp.]
MKTGSLITAVLVAVALYALVFERERLQVFAGREMPAAPSPARPDTPPAGPEADQPRRVHVVALDSQARTVDRRITLRGQTEAARTVQVMSQISGLVISDPRRKGSFVQAGAPLCQIDPGTRPAQLAEAQARLAEARIANTAAQRLAEGGFGSETQKLSAQAGLEAALAAVTIAETEIARLTITAPFAGLLETDAAELGSLLQPGSPCAMVIQLDPIKLVAFLPESELASIAPGASARATLSGGIQVAGTVSFLARSADPATRTFRVEIGVDNPDLAIRDGQSAAISIESTGTPAHFIPASALTLDDAGTMGLRTVETGDIAGFAPVRILRDTARGVYVTGLPDRARIIVTGQDFVTEGTPLEVTLRGNGP